MVDIAAADTTAEILWREMLTSPQGSRNPLITVGVRITVNPGTTDAYPTGGILLTPLFTTDDASDTYIDAAQPVVGLGSGILRAASGTFTGALLCHHYDGGSTPASQTLVCYVNEAEGSVTGGQAFMQHDNADITIAVAGSSGADGGIGGDTDPVIEMVFIGRLREGKEL